MDFIQDLFKKFLCIRILVNGPSIEVKTSLYSLNISPLVNKVWLWNDMRVCN